MEDKKTYVQRIKDYINENGSITVRDIQRELDITSALARLSDLKKELEKTDEYTLCSFMVKRKGKAPYKIYFIKNNEVAEEYQMTKEDWYDMVGCARYEDR